MAPAGSPEIGADTGTAVRYLDPSSMGQPCRTYLHCPRGACFFDARANVADCQGHCVPSFSSMGCAVGQACSVCLNTFGTECSATPGYACGLGSCGWGCLPPADGGIDSR